MKINIFIFFCIPFWMMSQQKTRFSVNEAVEYALLHHPQVKLTEKDVRLSHLKTQEFTGIGLPQVNAGASIQHFVKLPVSILPNFVAPAVYGGLVSAGVAPYDPIKLSPDGYSPIEAQFGQKYQASASFTASQLVFSSEYFIGLKASKSYENLSKLSLEQQKQQIRYQVKKSYYEHLLNARRKELLDVQLQRVRRIHEEMSALHKQGLAELLDVQRITLTRDQLQTEKEKITALLEISLLRLKFQMGYPQTDSLILSDTLDVPVSPAFSEKHDASRRYDYQILQRATDLQVLNKKRHTYGHIPSLVAFASGGYQAFNNEFDFWNNNVKWFPNFLIGASLQWNLFDGLQKIKRRSQSMIEIEKIKSQQQLLEEAAKLEQTASQIQWKNALASLDIRKKNYELAREVLSVTEKKYNNGVGSALEILQALSALKEAQVHYLESLFECKVAELDYLKSTGEL